MKRDLEKAKTETHLLLTIHFADGRTVNFETSSAKKARHVVYELGEKEDLDLEAWALRDSSMVRKTRKPNVRLFTHKRTGFS
jgi:hypothetical protein